MLHLFPIRYVLTAIIAMVALMVLAAVYAGFIGTNDAFTEAITIIRWSFFAALMLTFLSYAAWRWIPILQHFTFPYLGGKWLGELQFSGPKGSGTRPVSLEVSHTLFGIKLVLDSEESTSRTLAVHAERDVGVKRDRLYYVYLNERKEGVAGAGDRYRGLAVMRIESTRRPKLHGDYFTERSHNGTFQLTRDKIHPWWMIWQ